MNHASWDEDLREVLFNLKYFKQIFLPEVLNNQIFINQIILLKKNFEVVTSAPTYTSPNMKN
jgi:hypothetical protein